MAAGNFFGGQFFGGGFFGALPTGGAVGYGPGWKIIFDQDTLAKWEKERRDEGGRKALIGNLFERIYGTPQEAEPDAPAPAVALAEVRREKEAEFRQTRDKSVRAQVQILAALQERAQEMARLKAREYERAIDEDDEDILGMIV